MIYIASDHGGFKLKGKILEYFKSKHIDCEDMGPYEYKADDDYPDYIVPAVLKIRDKTTNKAILICRNGVGVCMLANKFKGIRAGLSWNAKHAKSSRTDDDTNVLALPADYLDEKMAIETVNAWLNTNFVNETKFLRRLEKVKVVEDNL